MQRGHHGVGGQRAHPAEDLGLVWLDVEHPPKLLVLLGDGEGAADAHGVELGGQVRAGVLRAHGSVLWVPGSSRSFLDSLDLPHGRLQENLFN